MKAPIGDDFEFFGGPAPTRGAGVADVDWGTAAGAERLAETINNYWARYGYDARARAIPTAVWQDVARFAVISEMRNGVPTRRLAGRAAPNESNKRTGG